MAGAIDRASQWKSSDMIDAIDAGGATIQRIAIARQATGIPSDSEFLGLMTVPDQPFRIRLSGETIDGRSVRRTFERRFEPTAAPYEVTFSQSGQYAPALSIQAMRKAATLANSDMYVLKSTIDPRPREVQASNHEAENFVGRLFQPADFLYVGNRTYQFAVDRAPDSVRVDKRGTNLCSQPRALDRNAATRAEPSASDTKTTYRLSVAGQTFEGAIADFDDPATLYQNLIAEGLQSCQ